MTDRNTSTSDASHDRNDLIAEHVGWDRLADLRDEPDGDDVGVDHDRLRADGGVDTITCQEPGCERTDDVETYVADSGRQAEMCPPHARAHGADVPERVCSIDRGDGVVTVWELDAVGEVVADRISSNLGETYEEFAGARREFEGVWWDAVDGVGELRAEEIENEWQDRVSEQEDTPEVRCDGGSELCGRTDCDEDAVVTLPDRHPPADERCAVHALADCVTGVGEATAQKILDEIPLRELVERCEGAEGPHGHPVTLTKADGIGPTRAASIAEAVDDSPLGEALDGDEDDVELLDVPTGVTTQDVSQMDLSDLREEYRLAFEIVYEGAAVCDTDEQFDAVAERKDELWTELEDRVDPDYPVCPRDDCESTKWAQTPGDPKRCGNDHHLGFTEEDEQVARQIQAQWDQMLSSDDDLELATDGGVVELTLSELTAFQRDALRATVELQSLEGPTTGSDIRRQLESTVYDEVTPGRLYSNLDTLVDRGLVEKGSPTRRSNDYQPTREGEQLLRRLAREIGEAVGLEVRG